jgi:hypothetical protein
MKINRDNFEFLVLNFKFSSKFKIQNLKFVFAFLTLSFVSALRSSAQPVPAGGNASNFSSVEYYPAPHQQQIKSRISGAEAQLQPDGSMLIKQLKLEMFDVNGKLEIVVDAPECVYDTVNGTANSSGELHVRTGDGKFRVQGEGFLWRQNDSFLTISNHVQTVIENATEIAQ